MKKERLLVWLCLCFFCCSTHLYAQQREWSGQVLDEKFKEPLIGVVVSVKGTQKGSVTDIDGRFSITADVGQELRLTYIGYAPMELKLTSTTNLATIVMSEESEVLEELVVVGYGVQKKASLVGSISTATGQDLQKTGNVTSVSEALQGILPGVVAIMTDGKPGADDASITIRGMASWKSSEPLVLVDGVERSMNDIDPNEIESLSVLKDASATAVFGVKGANGVILVTTKRGSNAKPNISFSANFGFKQPLTHPEYADYVTSMELWNEAATNDKQYDALIPESKLAAWKDAYATGKVGPYNDYFPEIDWWDEMIRDVSFSQQYNINVSGGTDFMRYFTSIGFLEDGDVYKTKKNDLFDPSFSYKRYNWRANLDFNLTKSTVFTFNFSGRQGYRGQPGYRSDGNNENDDAFGQSRFFATLYGAPRNVFPIRWSDGHYGVSNQAGQGDNLYLLFDLGQRTYKYNQNFIDFALKEDLSYLIKGLRFEGKLAYNTTSNTQSRVQRYSGGNFGETGFIAYHRAWDYSQPLADGGYALKTETRLPDGKPDFQGTVPQAVYDEVLDHGYQKKLYYEFSLNYNRTFDDHAITALGLFNRNQNDLLKKGSAKEMEYQYRDEAWITRLTYGWKERYLMEFNGAYQGSTKFERGKRYQFFPSYSIGWRASEEEFVKKYAGGFLDNLKFRYSFGVVGYDKFASAYAYMQMYENQGSANNSPSVSFGDYITTVLKPLYKEGATANANATWEEGRKQNFGIDLSLFNKLTATIDIHSEKRTGILVDVWMSVMTGATEASGNVGEAKNRGYEFELGWKDKIGKDWSYWVKGNYAFNENRVVYNDDPAKTPNYLKDAGRPIKGSSKLEVIGHYQSLDDIYNYAIAQNPTMQGNLVPGDFMYLDYDANGIIDVAYDKVPQKYNNFPAVTYGWHMGLQYKSFQVSAMFYGVSNIYKEVDSSVLWDFPYGSNEIYSANIDAPSRWAQGQTGISKPAMHSQHRGHSMIGGTTYSTQNAAYLRLKNVEISYNLSPNILKKSGLGIKSVQIYANGSNLWTLTDFNKQLDPEGSSSSVYPMVRRYNVGTRITF